MSSCSDTTTVHRLCALCVVFASLPSPLALIVESYATEPDPEQVKRRDLMLFDLKCCFKNDRNRFMSYHLSNKIQHSTRERSRAYYPHLIQIKDPKQITPRHFITRIVRPAFVTTLTPVERKRMYDDDDDWLLDLLTELGDETCRKRYYESEFRYLAPQKH